MELVAYIVYLNIIVWLFPPLKHHRRNFFYYFLILAVSDPLGILFVKLFGITTIHVFIVLSYCLVISVLNPRTIRKNLKLFITLAILVLLLSIFLYNSHLIIIIIITIHIIIFSIFVKNLVENSGKLKAINFFYVFLAFYEATLLIKFFVFTFKVETGIAYFYFTSAFQLLFGLYFSIATEEKPLITYNLVKDA